MKQKETIKTYKISAEEFEKIIKAQLDKNALLLMTISTITTLLFLWFLGVI